MPSVSEIASAIGLKAISENGRAEVTGVYICDMLSHAMAKCRQGNIWITILSNLNVAAVAHLTGTACVILAEGIMPDETLEKRSKERGIGLYASGLPAYELAVRLDGILKAAEDDESIL